MKKKLITKIMAFVMAVICVFSMVPVSYARADEKDTSARQQLKAAINLSEELLYSVESGADKLTIRLFSYYVDEKTYSELAKALENAENVYNNADLTDEDYLITRTELCSELDKFRNNYVRKEPDIDTLNYLIARTYSMVTAADTSDKYEDARPTSIWIEPSYYDQINDMLKIATTVSQNYKEADATSVKAVYDACVELDKMYYEAINGETELVRYKGSSKEDVLKVIDNAKLTLSSIKYYATKEEAEKAGETLYVDDKQLYDNLVEAIKNSENKVNEVTNSGTYAGYSYDMIYKYIDRARSTYYLNSKLVLNLQGKVEADMFYLIYILGECIISDGSIQSVLDSDGIDVGTAYVYYEDMLEFESALDKAKDIYETNKDNSEYDFKDATNELNEAINKINGKIKYKEYTMKDYDAVIKTAEDFNKQIESMKDEEQITEYGTKGMHYVTNAVKEELENQIETLKNLREKIADNYEKDPIETENIIASYVNWLKAGMIATMNKIVIVNTDADELNILIKGVEDIINTVYKSDDYDNVPAGELWISPEFITRLNKYIEIAKETIASGDIDAMNKAYNSLDRVREVANSFVKEGTAVVPAPDNEEATDNNSSSGTVQNTETPKTADMSSIYVYVLMAALSAGIMGVAVCNRKVRR